MKRFGIGAAIVPLVGGVPEVSNAATLIEVPKLQPLIAPTEVISLPPLNREVSIVVTITEQTGHVYQFRAESFALDSQVSRIDVTDHSGSGSYRKFIPGYEQLEWTLRGRLLAHGQAKFEPV